MRVYVALFPIPHRSSSALTYSPLLTGQLCTSTHERAPTNAPIPLGLPKLYKAFNLLSYFIYIYIYIYIYTYISYTNIYTNIRIQTQTHTPTHTRTNRHIQTSTHRHLWTCICEGKLLPINYSIQAKSLDIGCECVHVCVLVYLQWTGASLSGNTQDRTSADGETGQYVAQHGAAAAVTGNADRTRRHRPSHRTTSGRRGYRSVSAFGPTPT